MIVYRFMWIIHGRIYDLTKYLDKHPGGSKILELANSDEDITPLFESSHAMANIDKINHIMRKYEIGFHDSLPKYTFNDNDFYRTLTKRVRVTLQLKNYKMTTLWIMKSLSQVVLFFMCFAGAFYISWLSIYQRCISAFLAAMFLVQFGFGVMHDASHSALSFNPKVNDILSRIWNAIGLWDHQLWVKHHVIRHHAYTGDKVLDPDTIHFKPFIRKLEKKYDSGHYYSFIKYFPTTIALFVISIFPGMYTGQALLYHFVWRKRKYLWKIPLPENYSVSTWEITVRCIMLASFVYGGSFLIFLTYLISVNILYAICILPDHDTFETVKNKINPEKQEDWGVIQASHSANFATTYPLVCHCFGGINYQIEHHLFPTICHVHYPKIQPIVKKTCLEFGVPYVEHDSIWNAIKSTLKTYKIMSSQ